MSSLFDEYNVRCFRFSYLVTKLSEYFTDPMTS